MENKKVAKKSILYLVGNFTSKILSSLLVPIYAFYITATDLGTYDYSQTIMNILVPIIMISIWESILRFILSETDIYQQNKVLVNTAYFTLFVNFVFAIISIILHNFFQGIEYYWFIIIMFISSSIAQIWQYYARAFNKNGVFVISSLFGTLVNLVLNIILICYFKMGLNALYISFIFGQISIFIVIEHTIKVLKKLKLRLIDLKLIKKLISYSSPLVINSIAIWLINGFGKSIIITNLGKEANGLYSFASRFSNIVTVLGSVVSMAILEEAIINLRNNGLDESFEKTLEVIFKFFLSLILVSIPMINIIYSFFGKSEFYTSMNYLPIMMLYTVFMIMSTNFGICFKMINKNSYQVTTTIFGSIVSIIFSYAFIWRIGIYSVLIGQCIGALSMLLARYYTINKFTKFTIKWWSIFYRIIIYTILSLTSIKLEYKHNIFLFILFSFLAILDNKSLLISLKRKKD